MIKCSGCGIELQDKEINKAGYTTNMSNHLCMRCFRIKNYNDYQKTDVNSKKYMDIFKEVSKTSDLIVLVVDVFDIPEYLKNICSIIKNDIILVVNKRDILPLSVYDKNLENYFRSLNLNFKDIKIVSSKKNYNLDNLYESILKYKNSNKVYFVGYTNAGKSSLINKMIYNYSDNCVSDITISSMPATTLDTIEIKLNDSLDLVDTPGLLIEGSILEFIDTKEFKKIIPKNEIKPIVYQIKGDQSIFVDKYFRLDVNQQNDLIFYFSNSLDINRKFNVNNNFNDYIGTYLETPPNHDIVIPGLGFIKCKNAFKGKIYIRKEVKVFVRKSLI